MTTHLFALGNRARSTTAVQVLAVAAALIMAPTAGPRGERASDVGAR